MALLIHESCRELVNYGAIKNDGGVCAFVCKTLRSKQVSLSNNCVNSCTAAQTEVVCFDIYVAKTTYRIILLYRPPNSCFTNVEHCKHGIEALKTSLNELIHVQHTTFICGDFNLPNINWLTNNVILDDVHSNFFDFMSSHGMTQFVHQPTRHSSSGTDNVLDLIFSNDSLSVIITDIGHPLGMSDHATIENSTSVYPLIQSMHVITTPTTRITHHLHQLQTHSMIVQLISWFMTGQLLTMRL